MNNEIIIPESTQLKPKENSESLNASAGSVGVKTGEITIGVDKIDNSITLGEGSTYNSSNVKTVNKNRFEKAIGCAPNVSAQHDNTGLAK